MYNEYSEKDSGVDLTPAQLKRLEQLKQDCQPSSDPHQRSFWGDAELDTITANGGIDKGKGKFNAYLTVQYKIYNGLVYCRSLEYKITAPYYSADRRRANINLGVAAGSLSNVARSPDTLHQTGEWKALVLEPSATSLGGNGVFYLGIEVDFDGPDGGGWFWTWSKPYTVSSDGRITREFEKPVA